MGEGVVPLRILHVEDDPIDRELVAETLRFQQLDCHIVAVDTRVAFETALDTGRFDVILADDRLPAFDGQAALALAVERVPDTPFIFVSGTLGEEVAVERLKAGATDYIVKGRLARLGAAIARALDEAEARREHAQSEEAKLFLEDLIAASPSMIFRIDPRDFRINYASPNVAWLLGYQPGEIIGIRNFWRTLLHPTDLDRATDHLRQALETHTVQIRQEYRFRSRDGRYRWFFSLMRVEYDNARPMRILWYCIDISDRRAAEQALLESEERTRSILRTANDAFVAMDNGGRIVEWNERASAIFGWPREEAIGRILADTIVPDRYRPAHRNGFARLLETGEGRVINAPLELSALTRDGSEFPVELTIWRTGDGASQRFNAFLRDITERKRSESAIQQAKDEAERANHAKSEFLSRMSHELRTPLNAVLGFAQVLASDALDDDQRDCVNQITRGGTHLLDLINEVLDIARIEAGRLSLSSEPINVADTVRRAVELVAPLAAQRRIAIDVADVDGDSAVIADRQRLTQVLLNLLSNGVKYNRLDGQIVVKTLSLGSDRIRIEVTDTGAGIHPDKLQLLFSPFERLGAETTAIEGTGLGLVLSRRLVEAMGGSLGVTSEIDRGSTFWIELLKSAEKAVAAPTDVKAAFLHSSSGRHGTVLYIEDNVSNVRLMTRLLARRPSITLLHAADGEGGIAQARDHGPDVIFLDLHLPDMSGEEVLRQLWDDPSLREIPVVMLTADATPGQMRRALASGAAAYLTKPLDLAKVLEALDQMLQLSEERRAARS